MFKWKLLMSVMLMALMIGCTATPEKDDDDGDDDKKKSPTVVTYTVTFKSNGGSDVSSATVSSGEKLIQPAAPTKTGFGFAGWYKEDTFATEWNFTTDTVTGNITLYAKWTINSYTVTFNSNGGSVVSSATVNSGAAVTKPADPTKTNYAFIGWYKDDTFATEWNFATDTVTGNITLYAKWIVSYTVTFNSNGGSAVSRATVNSGAKVTRPVDPALSGFTFRGWYKDGTLTTAWDFSTGTITAATTLYAKWQSSKTVDATKATTTLTNTINGVGVPGVSTNLQGRTVNLTSFYMGKYEITYAQWYEVKTWATSHGYTFQNAGMEGSVTGGGSYPNFTNVGKAPTAASSEPVTCVSRRDCFIWCNALSEKEGLTPCYTYNGAIIKDSRDANGTACDSPVLDLSATGYRLPTEAEWEYAASYKEGTNWTPSNYASGAAADYNDAVATNAVAWYYNSTDFPGGTKKTQPVGRKIANALGLFDMSGNVWEWCGDGWWSITAGTPVTDPIAAIGGGSIIHGGSWSSSDSDCQVGYRLGYITSSRGNSFGFRVARR